MSETTGRAPGAGGGDRAARPLAAWDVALEPGGRERLLAALPPYLLGRRWFGGKARSIRRVELVDALPVRPHAAADGDDARIALLRVGYEDGEPELYALPLAFAPAGGADAARARLPGADVATLEVGGEPRLLQAVDVDERFARALLRAIAEERRIAGEHGELVAWRTAGLEPVLAGPDRLAPKALGGEQSNTSIQFGDALVMKLLRKGVPGPHPDLEIGTFLTSEARFPHTPAVLGAVEYRPRQGEPLALAVLQAFVANQGDAFTVSCAQVAACLERVAARPPAGGPPLLPTSALDAAAAPPGPAARELVGPWLDQVERLGLRTAELHRALAGTSREGFAPEPFSREAAAELAASVAELVTRTFALLRRRREALPEDARAAAERLLAREPELVARVSWVADAPPTAPRIRTHGDLHLGQVLFTGDDFVLIDFEGEPARPLAERREKRSPLRDVAGMLRSFHYAAYQGLAQARARGVAPGGPVAEGWARAWCSAVSGAYLRAWLEGVRGAGLAPRDPDELRRLLDLFLLEKAVYELGYELDNRPDWVALPLQGIADELSGGGRAAPPPARVLHAGGPTAHDLHLWNEGTNYRAYRSLGSHLGEQDGLQGASFAVWAPNAEGVSVMGDFNGWDKGSHPLRPLGPSGVWQGFVPDVRRGAVYKYHVRSRLHGYAVDKADPFAFRQEIPPRTGSVVWDLDYTWGDEAWMRDRAARNGLASPMSIYEVHLGSWRRVPEEGNRSLGYLELAGQLADYVADMGFTHVELLPVMEHPFYGSWGYQTTGYFAPTGRYGTPQELMALVDLLHQRGIGVLFDWVPSHFPGDEHGLGYFDGTHLFEHADPRQGRHQDWDSLVFNYRRNEVRSFLMSSALFWLDRYHADGLRVDAVASMLYLDYSRKAGEWIPNEHGGRESLDAIGFLRRLNEVVFSEHRDVQTIAEESTSWPMVSRPTYLGGLGFGMKWDMGWMHDTLAYMGHDPVFRKFHHNELTFRAMYAASENFVLPLSHDEVVHGKGSLLDKMWGVDRQKFAGLRLLLADMWAQPGKKLLFMGGELAQGQEWSHERSLDWHLLDLPPHAGVQAFVRDLNRLLRAEPALFARDFEHEGFEWVDCNDAESSVLSMLRRGRPGDADVLVVLNFTPVARPNYRVGVPRGGFWREVLNGDATAYGGSGWGNLGGVEAAPVGAHGRPWSLVLTLPPLAAVFLRGEPAP